MSEHNGTGAEAPVSWNVRYRDAEGFDCMLTLRGATGADVLVKATAATQWLVEHGARPDGYRPAVQATPDHEPTDDPSWCPIHKVAMKARTANGETWYSHKVGDTWCRGK